MNGSTASEQRFETDLPTEASTEELAGHVARLLRPGDLVILTGGLGAGKTFFTGHLMRALGLDGDEPVTSPTFALVNEYPATNPPACHADLYRLVSEDDVYELGLEERRLDGWLLVVEWGAPHAGVLGGNAIELAFELSPRRCSIRPCTPRAADVVRALRGE